MLVCSLVCYESGSFKWVKEFRSICRKACIAVTLYGHQQDSTQSRKAREVSQGIWLPRMERRSVCRREDKGLMRVFIGQFPGTWRPAALHPLGKQNSKLEETTGFRGQCWHKGGSHALTRAPGLSPLCSARQGSNTLQGCRVLCDLDTLCTLYSDGDFGRVVQLHCTSVSPL